MEQFTNFIKIFTNIIFQFILDIISKIKSFYYDNQILSLAIGCFVVLFLIALLFFVIFGNEMKHKKFKKKVQTLNERINGSIYKACEDYDERLCKLSSKNDEYKEKYEFLNKEFEKVKVSYKYGLDQKFQLFYKSVNKSNELKDSFRVTYRKFEKGANELESLLTPIYEQYKIIFKDADYVRVEILEVQKLQQEVLLEIDNYQGNLGLCKKSLDSFVEQINVYFDNVTTYLDNGCYEKSREYLKDLKNMVEGIYGNISKMAECCDLVNNVIPKQLNDLVDKKNRLERNGFVVSGAHVDEFVKNVNKILSTLKEQFQKLDFSDFNSIYSDYKDKYLEANCKLDKEVNNRESLKGKYSVVKELVNETEERFITTKRQYETMCDFFVLDVEIERKFNEFLNNATHLSDLSREYEGYLVVNAKNPASFMIKKVDMMEETANLINDEILFFEDFFEKMKNQSEKVYDTITKLISDLQTLYGKLNYSNSKQVLNKYELEINRVVLSLNDIKTALMNQPVNLPEINENYSVVVSQANLLINTIQNDLKSYQTIEKCIIYLNPLRGDFNEVERILSEVESLFIEEEYGLALDRIKYLLSNYHPAGFDLFEGNI